MGTATKVRDLTGFRGDAALAPHKSHADALSDMDYEVA